MRTQSFAWTFALEIAVNTQQNVADSNRAETRTWTQRLRTRIFLDRTRDADLTGTAILNAQVWIDQAPWRMTGLWSVLAGLLATDALRQLPTVEWKVVVLLVLLADPLWGSIWRMTGGRTTLLTLPSPVHDRTVWLPYLQTGSPAARLLGGDHTDVWPFAFRVGVPTIALSLVVAAVLGWAAVGFTVAVVLVATVGWTVRRTFGVGSPLLYSVIAVGLPWLLTMQLLGRESVNRPWYAPTALIGLWVVHQWGALRAIISPHDWVGLALLAVAQIGICLLFILIEAPLWLALVVVLFLPTWLLVYQQQPLQRLRVVWLGALLISAVALGQTS